MTDRLSMTLLSWSFAPVESLACDAESVASPDMTVAGLALDFIPAALRRRCSTFTKVTLAVAQAALKGLPGDIRVPTVFASSHGESAVTASLLGELARREQLSPMGFSLSVHNAASGLFSIATGNTAPASAVAAGIDCLVMGLCEVFTILSETDAQFVLLVCSDDKVAPAFLREGERVEPPYAAAFLLGRLDSSATGCVLSLKRLPRVSEVNDTELPQGMAVARWLAHDGSEVTVASPRSAWRIERTGAVASQLFSSPVA